MKLHGALLGVAFFFGATVANAALTSSEKGQIRDFVAGARAENADKVRSLVARTDLTPEESAAALTEAVAPVAFTEERGIFLKELAFGGASAASRPVLALAEVKAVLARADAIYQRYVGGLDHEPRAIQELVAIYGWLDARIANAGKPTASAHDASAGIPASTYSECAKVLGDHIDLQARWIKGDGVVPASIGRVRAQAQMALVDMMPDGLTRRVDAAGRLGLKGARRSMLIDWGILFAESGKLDDAGAEHVRQALSRLAGARTDLGLVYAGDDRGAKLQSRGLVTYVTANPERHPLSDAQAPASYNPAASAIVHDFAVIAAKRALDNRSDLRLQAERDAAAAGGDPERLLGRPRAPSVEHVIGAAIHALLTDGKRAIELSLSRLQAAHPQTAALLSDALGALSVFESEQKDGKTVEIGNGTGWTSARRLRIASNGIVLGFTVDGKAWSIDRSAPSWVVMGARMDGVSLSAP